MICPHCQADLLRKARTGQKCSRCTRPFAFEPKANPLKLHDLRMRRVVDGLRAPGSGGGQPLPYTADQLRHAAARKVLTGERERSLALLTAVWVAGITIFLAVVSHTAVVLAVGAVAVVWIVVWNVATIPRRRHPGMPVSPAAFDGMIASWVSVYGQPPPGLLPPGFGAPAVPPGPPRVAVYCTDPGTVDFLRATDLAARRSALVVAPASEPLLREALLRDPALPVIVLHDADPAGHLTAGRLRAALPAGTRVVDAGLRAATAARLGTPVLRRPDPAELAALDGTVTAAEAAWLAAGRTYALAALRPARLLHAVEQAIARPVDRTPEQSTIAAARAADPVGSRIAGTGFMDWPS